LRKIDGLDQGAENDSFDLVVRIRSA